MKYVFPAVVNSLSTLVFVALSMAILSMAILSMPIIADESVQHAQSYHAQSIESVNLESVDLETESLETENLDAENLETIVISASRIEMPIRQIGASITVMTQEEIERSGADTVDAVLRRLPSVSVSNAGGVGKTSSLRIRGEDGFRTAVFLDGIDISDPTSPQVGPRLEHVLASGIGRVEVLRGPQGLIYGADAGGVINLYTPEVRQGLAGVIDLEVGHYDTQRLAAGFGGGHQDLNFYVHAVDYSTEGFNARTDDNLLQDDDGYDNTTLHGRVNWRVTDALSVSFVSRDVDSDSEFDQCFDVNFARQDQCTNQFEQTQQRLSSRYTTQSFGIHRFALSKSETSRESFTDNFRGFFIEGDIQRAEYLGQFAVTPVLDLLLGIDYEDETVKSDEQQSRDQMGYFLEYQFDWHDQFFMTLGARYDDNEDVGEYTSYRLTSAYWLDMIPNHDIKLKASYGTGFRAPSLFEQAYNRDSLVAFAPALGTQLREETSLGFDIGLEWHTPNGQLYEIVYFDQIIKDEIFFDLTAFSGYLQSSGETESSGVEAIVNVPMSDQWAWGANYTYNETTLATGSSQRTRRPRHVVNLHTEYTRQDDRFVFSLHVRGAYDAIDLGTGQNLDDYYIVNAYVSYQLNTQMKLYSSWNNVFDRDYEEVPGFNTSERAGYFGVQWHF